MEDKHVVISDLNTLLDIKVIIYFMVLLLMSMTS